MVPFYRGFRGGDRGDRDDGIMEVSRIVRCSKAGDGLQGPSIHPSIHPLPNWDHQLRIPSKFRINRSNNYVLCKGRGGEVETFRIVSFLAKS